MEDADGVVTRPSHRRGIIDEDEEAEHSMMQAGLARSASVLVVGDALLRGGPTPPPDVDDLAEQRMMEEGLAQSEGRTRALERKESVMFASAAVLGLPPPARLDAELVEAADVPRSLGEQQEAGCCQAAITTLMVPFSFWPAEDQESPHAVATQLLERRVRAADREVQLWERTGLPREAAELSLHFRQLVGLDAPVTGPVQRLRVTDAARLWLFAEARLWADTKQGDYAGKRCEWVDVGLVIFPHGALLSVTLDWVADGAKDFSLSDLRTWLHVAKYRSVRVGVTRGWTFGQRPPLNDEDRVKEESSSLGLKLYAALYGGSGVSLGSLANWLVRMPWEDSSRIPRRVSRHEYCHHHSYALVEHLPPEQSLRELLFHIRKAYSATRGYIVQDRQHDKEVLALRANALVAFSREGVFGLEWGGTSPKKTFQRQFLGIFSVLTIHCLSERVTLDKLSYLAALQAQHLPTPGAEGARSLSEMERSRRQVMALATMLVRYRSSMASDDCGGRSVFREFFAELRRVHNIGALRQELREELQDTLSIVESDWMEKRRKEKSRELLWKLKRDEISKRKADVTARQKRVFDVAYAAFTAVGLPFLIVSNVWAMNNSDLPRDVGWSNLMIACGVVSVVLFLLIYLNFNRGRSEFVSLSAEEEQLNRVRLERFQAGSDVMEEADTASLLVPTSASQRRWQKRHNVQLNVNVTDDLGALDAYLDELERPDRVQQRDGGDYEYLGRPPERYSIDISRPMPAPNRRWITRLWAPSPAHVSLPTEVLDESRAPVQADSDHAYIGPAPRDFSFDLVRPVLPPQSAKQRAPLFAKLRALKPSSSSSQPASSSVPQSSLGPEPQRVSVEMQRERFSLDLQRDFDEVGRSETRSASIDIARPLQVRGGSRSKRRGRK